MSTEELTSGTSSPIKMDNQRDFLRKKSFVVPHVNPFIHDLKLSFADKVQIFFMSITIAPVRLILLMILLIIAWLIAWVSTIGMQIESKKPVGSLRRMLFQIPSLVGRMQFFVMGFLWVKVKGERCSNKEARLLVAAPHSSYFDSILWFSTLPLPSALSRIENSKVPSFGTLMKTMQPVLVSRDDPDSRQKTIQEIHRRTNSEDDWPQIIIFPEGTCTNRKALITFKAGAFIPGVPIQPILLRYPNYLDTYTWTMKGPGGLKLLWISLCQFYLRFQVEFLPVYHPNSEEIADPKLYAENVRHLMADALDVPCTDHTFEDCRLMYQAKSRNLPMEAGLVEFSKLNRKLGIDIYEMKELLDEFALISRSCKDGLMGIEEFAKHLQLPVTASLRDLFRLYDRNGTGLLDFREYVIGMSLVSQAAVTEKSVKLAFKVFDRNGDGLVSRDELDHVLKAVFGTDFDTQNIYDKIDTDKNGIDYDQFYSFVKKRPEYVKLFMSYAELEEDVIPETKSNSSIRHLRDFSSKNSNSNESDQSSSQSPREKVE